MKTIPGNELRDRILAAMQKNPTGTVTKQDIPDNWRDDPLEHTPPVRVKGSLSDHRK